MWFGVEEQSSIIKLTWISKLLDLEVWNTSFFWANFLSPMGKKWVGLTLLLGDWRRQNVRGGEEKKPSEFAISVSVFLLLTQSITDKTLSPLLYQLANHLNQSKPEPILIPVFYRPHFTYYFHFFFFSIYGKTLASILLKQNTY